MASTYYKQADVTDLGHFALMEGEAFDCLPEHHASQDKDKSHAAHCVQTSLAVHDSYWHNLFSWDDQDTGSTARATCWSCGQDAPQPYISLHMSPSRQIKIRSCRASMADRARRGRAHHRRVPVPARLHPSGQEPAGHRVQHVPGTCLCPRPAKLGFLAREIGLGGTFPQGGERRVRGRAAGAAAAHPGADFEGMQVGSLTPLHPCWLCWLQGGHCRALPTGGPNQIQSLPRQRG